MKVIMYHYCRPDPMGWERLKYLRLDNFRRQLDWFAEQGPFVKKADLLDSLKTKRVPDGWVLTFDDAMHDHYDFVFPELAQRGLWGIFYVPTGPYHTDKLLDVHAIHLLLAKHGGRKCLNAMQSCVDATMLTSAGVDEFKTRTYIAHDDDEATLLFKRSLNYFIGNDFRGAVVEEIAQVLGESLASNGFYVAAEKLQEMNHAGMMIGSHSVTHPVFSTLSMDDQKREIQDSTRFLGDVLGSAVETFCYPHGGFHTFNSDTERLLDEAGYRFSVNVESRDVGPMDIERRQAWPRYDCNEFPHGSSAG